MYIFPGCIANVNYKLLHNDDIRSPNDEYFRPLGLIKSIFQKTFIAFLKSFGRQCITLKIYSLFLFRNSRLTSVLQASVRDFLSLSQNQAKAVLAESVFLPL